MDMQSWKFYVQKLFLKATENILMWYKLVQGVKLSFKAKEGNQDGKIIVCYSLTLVAGLA